MHRTWVGVSSLIIGASLLGSCGTGSNAIMGIGFCDGYGENSSSPYVLPYPTGESYEVSQGNCRSITHRGFLRYSYDFDMPVGETIIASRAGTVELVTTEANGDCGGASVVIDHGDGTYARYLHLTSGTIVVSEGDAVAQGATLGDSGDTGCTGGFPHLHFDVTTAPRAVKTLPVVFSNTAFHPKGLREGTSYRAQ
jgi:murein DD-endopeptidase MepM/ murein hydrolase activator NlpD